MSNWQKKVHIESSMAKKEGQWSLCIGRWQILHDGHKQMFKQILDEGKNLLIGVRDGELDEKNPYTASEVMANICKHYENNILLGNVRVMILPDICSINFGRGVGYDIVEHIPPSYIAEISATKIREQNRSSL
jgi:hypothetical protein